MDAGKWSLSRLPYHPENGLATQSSAFYIFLVACFVIPLVLLKSILQRPKYNLPPSPPAYPIIGHLHLLGKLPHQSMANLAKTYGEIYSLRLGSVPAIVVTTPAMAKEFLQTHDKIWASRTKRIVSAYYFSYNHSGTCSIFCALAISVLSTSINLHYIINGRFQMRRNLLIIRNVTLWCCINLLIDSG